MSSTKKDPYASEAETQALLIPDTRMAAERKLARMMIERGADEQGAEAYLILWKIAVELLAEQPAQHTGVGLTDDLKRAIESMIESHEAGDLDGWEVQLVKRRLHEATNGIKGVA